jgi:hypothetical protein
MSEAFRESRITHNPCIHADFVEFSGWFAGGLQKSRPKPIYPPSLPDIPEIPFPRQKNVILREWVGVRTNHYPYKKQKK